MLQFAEPPGYRRGQPVRRPKLDPYVGLIDQFVEEDKERLEKQRHTAQRTFERLRDEHGYDGGVTIVKDYLHAKRLQQQEVFVPLSHPPGDAQVDFGEANVLLPGALVRAHYFVLDLPHSDDAFVMAFPAETTEAICEGHNQDLQDELGAISKILDETELYVPR